MENSETLEDEETKATSEEEQAESVSDVEQPVTKRIVNPEVSAVFAYNGKQFPVKVGEKCSILDLEVPEIGSELTVDTVLLGSGSESIMGDPYIAKAKVILESRGLKTKKLISFKKRRRKSSSKTTRGHRQKSTVFMTKRIEIPGLPNSYFE